MKKTVKTLLLSLSAFLCCVTAGCTSCEGNDEPFANVIVNEVREVSLNQTYTPNIELKEGAVLSNVKLFDEGKNEILLAADHSFTAVKLGKFTYKIVYEIDGVKDTYEFVVTVVDVVAPWIVSKPDTAFVVELGLYDEFATDLKYIQTDDDNIEGKEFVSKKVTSISKNAEKLYASEFGIEKYPFLEEGIYDIGVSISDVSGNTTETSYQINVQDTVAPMIEINPFYYAWDNDGVISIPTPTISELSDSTCTVVATKDTVSLPINNNTVAATDGDEVQLTYTAVDKKGNENIATTTVKVLPNGHLMDVADQQVHTVFYSQSAILDSKDGVRVIDINTVSDIQIKEGVFDNTDISAYKSLELTFDNEKSSEATVSVCGSVAGEKVVFGKVKLYSKHSAQNNQPVRIDISRFNISCLDGLYFEVNSKNNISFTIRDMRFSEESVTMPTGLTPMNLESCGRTTAEYDMTVTDSANHFSATVFAMTGGNVQFELTFDNGSRYKTPIVALNTGENSVSFIIDALTPTTDFKGGKLTGITVYSHEDYENAVTVDDIQFTYVDELTVISPNEPTEYYVDYGDVFVIPNIIACDKALIKSASVVSRLEGVAVGEECAMNGRVNLSNADGTESVYIFDYTIEDVFEKTHEFSIRVISNSNALSTSFTLGDSWVSEKVLVENHQVTSSDYEIDKDDVIIKKYYRHEKSSEWQEMQDNFVCYSVGQLFVRYVVEYQDERAIYEQDTYIHPQGAMFDFEKFSGGEHLGAGTRVHGDKEHGMAGISDEWSYEGNYSMKILPGNCNSAAGFKWVGLGADGKPETYDDVYAPRYLGYTANAITFWAKADKDLNIRFCPNNTGVWLCQIDIKEGVHQYVVQLSKPIDWYNCILFAISPDDTVWIDNFSFINLDDLSWQSFDGVALKQGDRVVLQKPTFIKSAVCLSENIQATNISYFLEITAPDGTKQTHDLTDKDKGLELFLTQLGKYTFNYKVLVGGHEIQDKKLHIDDYVLENTTEALVLSELGDSAVEDFPWNNILDFDLIDPQDPAREDFEWAQE